MTPCVQVVLSGTLTFGVPILWALRELVVLRRPRNDPGDGPDRPPSPPERDPDAPQLPACLIPKRQALRPARAPELV